MSPGRVVLHCGNSELPGVLCKTPFPDVTQVLRSQNITFYPAGPAHTYDGALTHEGAFTRPREKSSRQRAAPFPERDQLLFSDHGRLQLLLECHSFYETVVTKRGTFKKCP